MVPKGFLKILHSVDSTNNYAMAQLHAGMASHGMAWFAHEQIAGKGQRGKTWETEAGKNIVMSLILQLNMLNSSQQFYLSAMLAEACYDFFWSYAGDETKIKWPNDLFWRDRKAGGVLIETIFHGKYWKWAVIGIGININQTDFNPILKNPISLKQITGKEFDTVRLATELYELIIEKTKLLETKSFDKIIESYNQHLYKRNQFVKLKKGDLLFETSIQGVSAEGKLFTEDVVERKFDFEEVEWLL